MNLRFIDWIWMVRGSLSLPAGQSSDEAFDRLDPLFRQFGTSHHRTGDTLVFTKKDQAAQDKMSVFDGGVLRIEKGVAGSVLRYDMTSRILLFCFLAPLLFIGIAQLTVAVGKHQKPPTDAAAKAADAKKKAAAKKPDIPMNALDKALGAPAPEKKDPKKSDERKKKASPTSAYVLAAMFAVLYIFGRIFEDRLVKGLFRKSLMNSPVAQPL